MHDWKTKQNVVYIVLREHCTLSLIFLGGWIGGGRTTAYSAIDMRQVYVIFFS